MAKFTVKSNPRTRRPIRQLLYSLATPKICGLACCSQNCRIRNGWQASYDGLRPCPMMQSNTKRAVQATRCCRPPSRQQKLRAPAQNPRALVDGIGDMNRTLFQLSERKYTSSIAQVCTYPTIGRFRHRNPLPRDQRGNCPGIELHD